MEFCIRHFCKEHTIKESGFLNACQEIEARCFTSSDLSYLNEHRLTLLHKMLDSIFIFYKVTDPI